jgi:hypothetical protein
MEQQLFTIRPAAARANLTERSVRHLLEKGVIKATRREGLGNSLWLRPDEIVIARVVGDLMHLNANMEELKGLAQMMREKFDTLLMAREGNQRIVMTVTPHENGVPMYGDFEYAHGDPAENEQYMSVPANRSIVYNIGFLFSEVLKDGRKFVRESFKPSFVIRPDQRLVIAQMLNTHNEDEVTEFFKEAASCVKDNGDQWR